MNEIEKIFFDDLKEEVRRIDQVGGGSIAKSAEVLCMSGNKFFVKSYNAGNKILQAEAHGLNELLRTNTLTVPDVIYVHDKFLILEFIDSAGRKENFSEEFGQKLAEMHKHKGEKFGYKEDNFIGASPQLNTEQSNWTDFFIHNRLNFQVKFADRKGLIDANFRTLFSKLENLIPDLLNGSDERPALIHGDLWRGNYMPDANGSACIFDPAVYFGHREMELAMTRLFGGFDQKFYAAYNEAYPLPDGWKERVELYQLYHVLNHLNLFGQSYYSQALGILKQYV